MIKLLAFLWCGCWHKWEILREVGLTVSSNFGSPSTGTRYFLRCERCGDVKKKDLA